MTPFRLFLCATAVLSSLVSARSASAGPCGGGGSLTITASSDSLTLTPVAATTFNFGEHVLLTANATGFSPTSYSWTIDGPTLKDYNENLGTENTPVGGAALPWTTTALGPADLAAASVGFYWVPAAGQVEPNNGPFTRNVTVAVIQPGGGSCSATAAYTVERNESDITRQAEDFYTSNHRSTMTTNPSFGHVIDEHLFWHLNVDGNQPSFPGWMGFLAWHGEFVRRFDTWREQFGYNKVVPWYPGRPLPTGPQFDADAGLRAPFTADDNRIPAWYTITGSPDPDSGGQKKLADYATLSDFTTSFESSFHGHVHCDIGVFGSFFESSGPAYGSMCLGSSPKDPMFWRWHGFIDVLYRNYCALKPGACASPSPVDPPAHPWMADNATDVADNGTVPSPGTHWISPDVWNRRAPVTTDACVQPPDAYGDHVTTGGVVRDCGTSADHENPVTGVKNYLYGTLRNTLPGSPRVVYAEVGVYYALASSGLTYPTDFTLIPDSRQFIALHLEPGTTTSIGPIPWMPPPLPPANDHYCLYLRVLSVQATPPVEGLGIDTDVANNNNLAWRNIKVVAPGDNSRASFMIVRNITERAEPLTLRFDVAPELLQAHIRIHVTLDKVLTRALRAGKGEVNDLRADGRAGFLITGEKAAVPGLLLAPRKEGHVRVVIEPANSSAQGDITISQIGAKGVEGGVTLRLANPK
jgi:hypothetical protein